MSKLLKKIIAPDGELPRPDDAIIELGSGYTVIVDRDDLEWLSRYRWFAKKSAHGVYACRKVVTNGREYTIRMHREITNCPGGFLTHHKNKNTLDNRRSNLQNMTPEDHKFFHKFSLDK